MSDRHKKLGCIGQEMPLARAGGKRGGGGRGGRLGCPKKKGALDEASLGVAQMQMDPFWWPVAKKVPLLPSQQPAVYCPASLTPLASRTSEAPSTSSDMACLPVAAITVWYLRRTRQGSRFQHLQAAIRAPPMTCLR